MDSANSVEKQTNGFILSRDVLIDPIKNQISCMCYFDTTCFEDILFDQLSIAGISELTNAVTKRKAEFLVGRYAAQQALLQLGVSNFTVAVGTHRAPIWPTNVVGSITHTKDVACCSVAKKTQVEFVGIDIEEIIKEETASNIYSSVIDSKEKALLQSFDIAFELALTIVFSAKESLFKAIYSQVGRYFDFHAAEVFEINPAIGQVKLRLTENLSETATTSQVYECDYQVEANKVFTRIVGRYN